MDKRDKEWGNCFCSGKGRYDSLNKDEPLELEQFKI